jgi:hypothetical protein
LWRSAGIAAEKQTYNTTRRGFERKENDDEDLPRQARGKQTNESTLRKQQTRFVVFFRRTGLHRPVHQPSNEPDPLCKQNKTVVRSQCKLSSFPRGIESVRKRISFKACLYYKCSFYPDRLGTNIGKALKRMFIKSLSWQIIVLLCFVNLALYIDQMDQSPALQRPAY